MDGVKDNFHSWKAFASMGLHKHLSVANALKGTREPLESGFKSNPQHTSTTGQQH